MIYEKRFAGSADQNQWFVFVFCIVAYTRREFIWKLSIMETNVPLCLKRLRENRGRVQHENSRPKNVVGKSYRRSRLDVW